jgi:hypothetical protein
MVRKDKIKQASAEIYSHGGAKKNAQTHAHLNNLHPHREKDLILNNEDHPQAHVSLSEARAQLLQSAKLDDSPGPFFWSGPIIKLIRNTPFFAFLTNYTQRVANADRVPPAAALVLSPGNLFAKNKVCEEDQKALEEAGQEPSIRPVNHGATLLKWGLSCTAKTKEGKAARAVLGPIQRGVGAARGPESTSHLFRALYEAGYTIVGTDFTCAFNMLMRQVMLDKAHKHAPGLTRIFNTYYGIDSICFYTYDEVTHVIHSEEGPRMGCALGSLGFGLGVNDLFKDNVNFIRNNPRNININTPNIIARALTDDLNKGHQSPIPVPSRMPATPPTHDSLNPDDQAAMIQHWADINAGHAHLEKEGERIGLIVKPSKSKILIPPHLPDPPPGITLPYPITREGITIGGAHIGTDSWVTAQTAATAIPPAIQAVEVLADTDPQVAGLLLRASISIKHTYLCQVNPTHLITTTTNKLDDLYHTAFHNTITLETAHTPTCSIERMQRASTISHLPIRHGGLGITKIGPLAPISFISSVAHCVRVDTDLETFIPYLHRFLRPALSLVHTSFVPQTARKADIPNTNNLLPPDLLDPTTFSTFYRALLDNASPSLRLQKGSRTSSTTTTLQNCVTSSPSCPRTPMSLRAMPQDANSTKWSSQTSVLKPTSSHPLSISPA